MHKILKITMPYFSPFLYLSSLVSFFKRRLNELYYKEVWSNSGQESNYDINKDLLIHK